MDKIKKLIKEALLNHKHDCGCGCHGKCAKAPMLNENLGAKVIMTENMQYHIDNKKALTENTFRYGSKAFLDLWAEARYLYSRDAINLSGEDKIIVETTHLGEYGLFEGEMVPLDLPVMEEVDEAISGADKDVTHAVDRRFNYINQIQTSPFTKRINRFNIVERKVFVVNSIKLTVQYHITLRGCSKQ